MDAGDQTGAPHITFAFKLRMAAMDLLEKMTTFVRVVEAGGLSAAARQLRVSPAAVSRQISTLEAALRTPLLLRTTRRMVVTEGGRRYYERCVRILREVEDAQSIGREDAAEGLLKLSAPVTFGLARVVPQMHSLLSRHPGLRVDLRLEDRVIDLALEDADVAIRVGIPLPDSVGLVAHKLQEFRRVLVAAPGYLRKRGEPKTPEALARHDALVFSAGAGDSWALYQGEREARVRINVLFRSNSLHALRELAVSGDGIALVPAWFVREELRARSLRTVLAGWQSEVIAVNAIHRTAHRRAVRVRALIDHLRSAWAAG
jgi:DNA-binding transcriptional LysR family regulator